MSHDSIDFSGKRPLIVRRQRPGDSLIATLVSSGAAPLELPVMRMVPPDAASQNLADQVFENLARFSIAVFTSPYLAERVLDELQKRHLKMPTDWRCLAVGQGTANVLRAAGYEVMAPERDMTSEGVLELSRLPSMADQQVVIFRGEGGRRVMDQKFAARGAIITSCPLYRRELDPSHRQILHDAIRHRSFDVVVVHSGELLDNLTALLPDDLLKQLFEHRLLVPHPRVANTARSCGAQQIEIAENASTDAIIAALVRCYS